jgi:transposase InsO family protein
MNQQARRDIARKLRVLEHATGSGNISFTCRHFGISRETFYQWKRAHRAGGNHALINSKPCPANPKLRTKPEVEQKILYLRRTYHFGPLRISWYLHRYHGIKISTGGIYRVLKRHELNCLPGRQRQRSIPTLRYEKRVPGHQIQVDVKFLDFVAPEGRRVRRFQYTAIDDATRVRALKIYHQHTQQNAIDLLNYVVSKFPFRIKTVRTDNGHEFQAKFHWHVEDLGMRHVYIKPRTPRLNGKVERSHGTDQREFYQLLTYKDDVDLQATLSEWEAFYNYHRPDGSLQGKTPYELLREKRFAVAGER